MAAFENGSRPMSRLMMLGIVAMVAALGYLGWRSTQHTPTALPVSQEAAPAPEPTLETPPPPPAAPVSGDRAAG